MKKAVLVLCIAMLFCIVDCAKKKKMKVKMVKAEVCELPKDKMAPSPPMSWTIWTNQVDRETMINVNISVSEKYGPISFSGRAYQVLPNSAKALVFKLEKVSCRNPIVYQIIRLTKPKFDNKCWIDPGVYILQNVNAEILQWIISKTITTSSMYIYEMEYGHPKGVLICMRVICDVKLIN